MEESAEFVGLLLWVEIEFWILVNNLISTEVYLLLSRTTVWFASTALDTDSTKFYAGVEMGVEMTTFFSFYLASANIYLTAIYPFFWSYCNISSSLDRQEPLESRVNFSKHFKQTLLKLE